MSSQDTKDILAKLEQQQAQINALRGVTRRRREEVKDQREDIDKNKKVLTALHSSIDALTFMVKNIIENLDKYDEKDDIKVKIEKYLVH